MFVFNNDVIPTDCEPGVTRKILTNSDELMMCEITFKRGQEETLIHTHIFRLHISQKEALNSQLMGKPE